MNFSPWEAYFQDNGHPTQQGQLLLTRIAGINSPVFTGVPVAPSYTVATLPSPVAGGFIFVTDESGGATLAMSDGVDWRRVTDRAVVT